MDVFVKPKLILMSSESSYGLVPPEHLPIVEEEPLRQSILTPHQRQQKI